MFAYGAVNSKRGLGKSNLIYAYRHIHSPRNLFMTSCFVEQVYLSESFSGNLNETLHRHSQSTLFPIVQC